MTKDFFQTRPLSWSAIASWEYDPEQWYTRYILNEKQKENKEMLFGKVFAQSCEDRKPLAKVKLLKEVEYPLATIFNGIKLIGFIDTYKPHSSLGEFKTSKKIWTQNQVDNHGQLDMYCLQLYVMHKVKPEDLKIYLQCIQTKENGDFSITFADSPPKVHTFKTKRTMVDILNFGQRINKTVASMITYANNHESNQL